MKQSIGIILALFLAAGCAPKGPSPTEKMNLWLNANSATLPMGVYHVEPPDVIEVSAPRITELNGRTAPVSPDGTVNFNLIGSVEVAGRTPEQISSTLMQMASKYYGKEALDITVTVKEYKSKFIYVFGQVNRPGPMPYTGRDSIVKVLADVQLNEKAWAERIVIVRPNEDPNIKQRVTLDVSKMYDSGNMAENILLEDGDVVYVPPTPLAQANITVGHLLAPVRPVVGLLFLAGL